MSTPDKNAKANTSQLTPIVQKTPIYVTATVGDYVPDNLKKYIGKHISIGLAFDHEYIVEWKYIETIDIEYGPPVEVIDRDDEATCTRCDKSISIPNGLWSYRGDTGFLCQQCDIEPIVIKTDKQSKREQIVRATQLDNIIWQLHQGGADCIDIRSVLYRKHKVDLSIESIQSIIDKRFKKE